MASVKVDERHAHMANLCLDAGMLNSQIDRLINAGYVILPQMMPFHAAAREADDIEGPDEIAMGGTRGPGKSYAVMAQVGNDDCQRVPRLKVLFLRKIMKSAAESLDDLAREVFKYTPHSFTQAGVQFPNGSRILIGGYKDPRDIDKYLGIQYDVIAIEEATQLPEEKKEKIRGSLRSSIPGWKPRIYLTTNADGIGLAWFKRTYVIPKRTHTEKYTRFFDVSYQGNPFLDPAYVRWLTNLKGPLGKAWREADWDAFAGMAFPEFSYERHVVEAKDTFEIPLHWVKWTATDWGLAAPWSTHFYAKNPDTKRIYSYRELYMPGLSDRQQARMILDYTPPTEKIQLHYADPSMWARKSVEDKIYSTADTYHDEGVNLTKADNDRMSGMRKVHNALADLADGRPGLMFFENCPKQIEQISTLVLGDIRVEDVADDQEDHAFDELKYALTNERRLVPTPAPKLQQNPMNVFFNKGTRIRR